MPKNIRIELEVVVTIHVGEDVQSEGPGPERAPDACEQIVIGRCIPITSVPLLPREIAKEHIATMLQDVEPGVAERIVHQLRLKGL